MGSNLAKKALDEVLIMELKVDIVLVETWLGYHNKKINSRNREE